MANHSCVGCVGKLQPDNAQKVLPTNQTSNHPTNDSMIHKERGASSGGIGV